MHQSCWQNCHKVLKKRWEMLGNHIKKNQGNSNSGRACRDYCWLTSYRIFISYDRLFKTFSENTLLNITLTPCSKIWYHCLNMLFSRLLKKRQFGFWENMLNKFTKFQWIVSRNGLLTLKLKRELYNFKFSVLQSKFLLNILTNFNS